MLNRKSQGLFLTQNLSKTLELFFFVTKLKTDYDERVIWLTKIGNILQNCSRSFLLHTFRLKIHVWYKFGSVVWTLELATNILSFFFKGVI